jgi:diphosphomevalonate decarboxylase|tara:strand:+ start:5828 stop:6898 length:1071 start_codon:yes stop_codon:yes gene_type:complete
MESTSFISKTAPPISYKTSWRAPSNIALVKYWGKYGAQLPKNPSLSFTLSSSTSETSVVFTPHSKSTTDFEFYFHKVLKEDFKPKVANFLERIRPFIPWIGKFHLEIHSENSFPHSSGIASSASSMAALSLCLMDLERQLFPEITNLYFHQKASFLARLGSGSAARSIQGPVTLWGKNNTQRTSSDIYATPFGDSLHSIFKTYQDTILLVDKGSKSVSSSLGHDLMHGHPFAENRFSQATKHLSSLISIMEAGALDDFMRIVELEALSLHSMMMTSSPYFILMQPNTLAIIQKVLAYRESTSIPLCFTLDAGANLHLLYPHENKESVLIFIKKELSIFCENEQYLLDEVGIGAKKM